MTDKEKIRAEIERRVQYNILCYQKDKKLQFVKLGKIMEDEALLSFVDSMQEEPVSIWHDVSEEPKPNMELICIEQYGNPLVLSSNSNSFNERYISKWAYFNDLLNLSNPLKLFKHWKEPVSN